MGLGLSDLGAVEASAWLPEPLLFAGASLLLLAGYFFSAALWGLIVKDLGGPELRAFESIQLFMIANLARYLPGKIWQIAGLAALGKTRGVPATTGTGAAVLGQGLTLVAASAIGMGAFLTGPEAYRMWGAVGAVAVGLVMVLLAIPVIFAGLAGVWFRLARTEAPPDLSSVHGLRWLIFYAANWLIYTLSFWVLSLSLGLEAALVPVASAFAAAYVLGYVAVFAPAGVGVREGFLIAFLTPHFGVGPSGVIAVVQRLWTTAVEVVPAGIFWTRYVASTGRPSGESTGEGAT